MLDWTDRHCRYFLRQLSRTARLYSEMVNTGALLHGDVARHLDHDASEHPLALQLGGNVPPDLAACARLAQTWGYDEVNLNCGCPSDRVQQGAFGVCLMRNPQRVADCVRAMTDACSLPVTVKHRIGIDQDESYAFVRDFVGTVAQAGCSTFIVHARNAWLRGLSPRENREVPPLRYDVAAQLRRDFPHLTVVVNGGLTDSAQLQAQWQQVHGVMVGRAAYHNPWWLSEWDSLLGQQPPAQSRTREEVELAMCDYMQLQAQTHGTPWFVIARHMLGLRLGLPGARRWRRVWSDRSLHALSPHQVMQRAHGATGP